jgi:exonuclease III
MTSDSVFVWNVCGLNGRARRNVVRDLLAQERATLVCLQETKVSDVTKRLADECLGPSFDYAFMPAINTAGGGATRLAL